MPERQTRIRAVHSAQGAIVMDIDRGKVFSLNGTASAIYELLAAGVGEQAIVDEVARRFSIPADTVKNDLHAFRSLLNFHAIEPRQHRSNQ